MRVSWRRIARTARSLSSACALELAVERTMAFMSMRVHDPACRVAFRRPCRRQPHRTQARLAEVEGLPHAPRALPRAPRRLRRHLPRSPRRRRPHLGGPLHGARRARAQGRDRAASPTSSSAPTPRRGCALRDGELSGIEAFCAAAPLRARRPRPRRRLRGPVPAAERPAAAAARPRRAPARPARLDADDGRGPRRRCCSTASAAPRRSFFDTAAALSRAGYRVHALDLPGFGCSSKPAIAPYTAALVRRDRRAT